MSSLKNQTNFAMVPEWVLYSDLSAQAIRVYAVLNRYANDKTGHAFPSRRTLAERARCSPATLDRGLRELEGFGAIEVAARRDPKREDRQTSNDYLVRQMRNPLLTSDEGGTPTDDEGGSSRVRTQEPDLLEPEPSRTRELLAPTPLASERSLLFDALCRATGRDPKDMTKREARATAIAMESLLEVGAVPEEVMERAYNYVTHYPEAALTPHALVLHWSLCARPKHSTSPGEDTYREALRLEEEEKRDRQRALEAGG